MSVWSSDVSKTPYSFAEFKALLSPYFYFSMFWVASHSIWCFLCFYHGLIIFLCYGLLLSWLMLFGPLSANFTSKILEISLENLGNLPRNSWKFPSKILENCLENLGNLPPNF